MKNNLINYIAAISVLSKQGIIELLKGINEHLKEHTEDGVEIIDDQKVYVSNIKINGIIVTKYTLKTHMNVYIKDDKTIIIHKGLIYSLDDNSQLKLLDYKELYKKCDNLINRCERETSSSYNNYGLKGINVCEEWRLSPEKFVIWSILEGKYFQGAIIDRIDNSKGYYPNNIRFTTPKGSCCNRTNTIFLSLFNDYQPLSIWAERAGYTNGYLGNIYRQKGEDAVKDILRKRLYNM